MSALAKSELKLHDRVSKNRTLRAGERALGYRKKIQLLVDRKQTERMGCLGLILTFGHPSAPGAEMPKDDGGGRSLREEFVERRLHARIGRWKAPGVQWYGSPLFFFFFFFLISFDEYYKRILNSTRLDRVCRLLYCSEVIGVDKSIGICYVAKSNNLRSL
jgi:hypothetical protein